MGHRTCPRLSWTILLTVMAVAFQPGKGQSGVPALGAEYNDVNKDGSYRFGFQTGDAGAHYQAAVANQKNQVAGRFGSWDPAQRRIVDTEYTAGRRGFRARGPNIARKMDLSQAKIPYNPPVSPNSPNYNPTYDGYHDPNEDPSYSFQFRTPTYSKQEVSDSNGRVNGAYYFYDDIGERHDVTYEAGAKTGFNVNTPFPDSKVFSGLFYKGPPAKGGTKSRGKSSIQQRLDGSYRFVSSGPDQRRTEVSDSSRNVRGSYTYVDDKGQQRTVEYIAGPNIGYRIVKKGIGPNFPAPPPFIPPPNFTDLPDVIRPSSSPGGTRPGFGSTTQRPSSFGSTNRPSGFGSTSSRPGSDEEYSSNESSYDKGPNSRPRPGNSDNDGIGGGGSYESGEDRPGSSPGDNEGFGDNFGSGGSGSNSFGGGGSNFGGDGGSSFGGSGGSNFGGNSGSSEDNGSGFNRPSSGEDNFPPNSGEKWSTTTSRPTTSRPSKPTGFPGLFNPSNFPSSSTPPSIATSSTGTDQTQTGYPLGRPRPGSKPFPYPNNCCTTPASAFPEDDPNRPHPRPRPSSGDDFLETPFEDLPPKGYGGSYRPGSQSGNPFYKPQTGDSTFLSSNKNYFSFPHGVAVRAHIQSLDILPFGSRIPPPGLALEQGISSSG